MLMNCGMRTIPAACWRVKVVMFTCIGNISLGNKEKQHNGRCWSKSKPMLLRGQDTHYYIMRELNEEVFSQPIGIKQQMQIKISAALR